MAGGIFFALSGLVFPGCITNITYVFSKQMCDIPDLGAAGPYAWNAMAHFGITCFMVGTAIGFKGVLGAPKNKIVSPFWGPVLAGGLDTQQNTPSFDMTSPSVADSWAWN